MPRPGYSLLLLMMSLAAAPALATPVPNSAVIHARVFNDCPASTLTVTNLYPASIVIADADSAAACVGFANLHTWRFSTDGVNPVEFQNGDACRYSSTLVLDGVGEGGLNLSPWWSPDTDGMFNVRPTDGEIACFGGRMPFFSFTAAFGLHYVNNTPITLGILYNPRGLSAAQPAQATYTVRYNDVDYTSGPLDFDQGNPAEDPPHGQWGALTPWYAGGHVKMFVQTVGQPHGMIATWTDIQFDANPTPAIPMTWGRLKAMNR